MKRKLLLSAFLMAGLLGFAQLKKQDTVLLKKVMELKVKGEGGANGAAVTWDPVAKRYYTAIAGNADFPMSVFNASGILISDTNLKTQIDVRGLWYNTKTKALQANGYSETGWVSYKLNAKGIPESVTTIFEGMIQPNEHAVGTYDAKSNTVYFLDTSEDFVVENYNPADGKIINTIFIHPGTTKAENVDLDWDVEDMFDYNATSVAFTGIPKSEIGLLNVVENQVELFNLEGLLTKVLKLPQDALAYEMFNFSYCNGIYWLFDKENRKWVGYK
ncbi:MAG TPA: hypothetical protein PKN21_02900 [Bacteroidales bacterium]|nr:hypothetical protein [Bacteroidales bacterium]